MNIRVNGHHNEALELDDVDIIDVKEMTETEKKILGEFLQMTEKDFIEKSFNKKNTKNKIYYDAQNKPFKLPYSMLRVKNKDAKENSFYVIDDKSYANGGCFHIRRVLGIVSLNEAGFAQFEITNDKIVRIGNANRIAYLQVRDRFNERVAQIQMMLDEYENYLEVLHNCNSDLFSEKVKEYQTYRANAELEINALVRQLKSRETYLNYQQNISDEIFEYTVDTYDRIYRDIEHLQMERPTKREVYQYGFMYSKNYSVLNRFEGIHTGDIMDERPDIELLEIINITIEILTAYRDQVRKYGLVHRDLKPQNLLFNLPLTKCTYFDYDVAQKPGQSPCGLGTLFYAAPETDVTKAYDIYSLGLLLIEMWNSHIKNRRLELSLDDMHSVLDKQKCFNLHKMLDDERLSYDYCFGEDINSEQSALLTQIFDGMTAKLPEDRWKLKKIMASFLKLRELENNRLKELDNEVDEFSRLSINSHKSN